MRKIFVIGLHRTGTRSTTIALQRLGYDIIHYPNPSTGELSVSELNAGPPWNIINVSGGLSDIVTVPYYKQLDNIYQHSMFILTIRDINEWAVSVLKQLKRLDSMPLSKERIKFDNCIRNKIYGTNELTYDILVESYNEHHKDVIEYFGPSSSILQFDVNDGWKPLVSFLNLDEPPIEFPKIS